MTARSTRSPSRASASSFEPREDQGRQIGGRIRLAVKLELKERVAHVGLEEAGDLRVPQPGPLFRFLPHHGRVRAEVDDRRSDVLPVAVGDHLGPAVALRYATAELVVPRSMPTKWGIKKDFPR